MCLMRVRDDGRPFVHASAAWPRCPLPLPLLLPSPFDTAFVSEAVVSAAARAAATIAPKTSLLLPMNCPPQVAVPQGQAEGTKWRACVPPYSPRGRAAPKKRPPSDFTKPIRSYICSSVGSDVRRAFSAPTASSL